MISKEQVEELAVFAGFTVKRERVSKQSIWNHWYLDSNYYGENPPDFPTDLNACFKYIVPKLQSIGWMARVQWSPLFDNDTGKRLSDWTGYAHIYNIDRNKPLSRTADYYAIDKESATALCLAVLKLIKEEKAAKESLRAMGLTFGDSLSLQSIFNGASEEIQKKFTDKLGEFREAAGK